MNKKSDFWELSVATYSRPGVADACLSLQDRHSLDVNLVLFCCWYGSTRGLLNKDIFERVIVFSESWATHVVRPLRNIRTWMKHPDSVEVWQPNKSHLNLRNAIKKSELCLNPQIDGQLIRLPVPDLSEERRNEMKKLIKSMGEKSKISVRNIRREANDELKKLLKSKEISEDEEKKFEKIIQTSTDTFVKKIDEKVEVKEKEIMKI